MQEDVRSPLFPSCKLTESVTLLPAAVPVQPVSEAANAVAKTAGWSVVFQPCPPARALALRAARMTACENILSDGLDIDKMGGFED